MPEKWVLRVYAMGCAIPDCYEFKESGDREIRNAIKL
jgi:hypothetical protein